ncbi:MAG TPA: cupin domain-containing protein [Streptosporangiaceae bacterium]|jgi:mannose-6-phosphate isomerase-like protein (cupin superfamily)
MTTGVVVRADSVPAELTETGVSLKLLLDTGTDGPGLVRRLVTVPPGGGFAGTAGAAGELWFVLEGAARLELDGTAGPELSQDMGLWIPPGAAYDLAAASSGELRLDIVTLPAAEPAARQARNADTDSLTPRVQDLAACEVERTGDREFRVLFGPGHGCSVATQFVGEIPPGRAPDHSHPYDEVVLILAGDGVAHIGGSQHALTPGTCLHLPPGLQHCLENTGPALLRVLGVFHPADSPAAKLQPRD